MLAPSSECTGDLLWPALQFEVGISDPGDKIRVTKGAKPPRGQAPIAGPEYSFYDFQRGTPLSCWRSRSS